MKISVTMWLALAIVGVLATGARGAPGLLQAREPRVVDQKFFGMQMHYMVRPNKFGRTTAWPNVAFGSWRLVDAYVRWFDLEPKKGQWQFDTLDRYVQMAVVHNVDLVYTFGFAPRWASARPDEPSYTYGDGVAAEPRSLEDWASYVRSVVSRYRGKIRFYEIWNEPWFSEIESPLNSEGKAGFYSGSAEKMVEMAQVAYQIIKSIDPDAMVITPSMDAEDKGVRRLELYLSLGGAKVTDIIGFHFYTSSPERIPIIARRLRDTAEKYGLGGVPIWNTESGFSILDPEEPQPAKGERALSAEEAAGFVVRSLALAAGSGVERFFWYGWDNAFRGLTRGRGREPNDAASGYQRAMDWLSGAQVDQCGEIATGVWSCRVTRSAQHSYLLWTSGGKQAFNVPTAWSVRRYETMSGQLKVLPSVSRLELTGRPILLSS